ncbi:MAG TPA: selenium cofactor biosynthesis protein YqeC [Anaerolineales bacterium]|nr:selenium cofactor biosynthesis protein YqeC [Anaerolineales bacterium]
MNLPLVKALRIQPTSCVAFVGAGGKTTTMFKVARELTQPVIVTATTHLGAWQTKLADIHITATNSTSVKDIEEQLHGVLLVTGEREGDRTKTIKNDLLASLHSFCQSNSIPMLIEADGASQKNIKAWADHEPPIPKFADQVVNVLGMQGLGKPLTEETVHRAEIFSKLSGLKIGETITVDSIDKILTHESGGLKNIPKGAKRCLLLNQADTSETQSLAQSMKERLLLHFESIIVASVNNDTIHAVHERIAGIILAAGFASRFGKAKQVLQWKGDPFVRVVAKTALRAGLYPIIVVTGARNEEVESAVHDLDVKIVHNENWGSGQGSSIKAGVESLPTECGGAIFLLADQPQVKSSVLRALQEKHAEGLYPVVAPMVLDQRANPVLFDRISFDDLKSIEGDTGGRSIFHKYRVEYLPWHDDGLLLDVDTPEQYQRLISNEDI